MKPTDVATGTIRLGTRSTLQSPETLRNLAKFMEQAAERLHDAADTMEHAGLPQAVVWGPSDVAKVYTAVADVALQAKCAAFAHLGRTPAVR